MDNIGNIYALELNNKREFQKELAGFAMRNNFQTIVETGYGVSTLEFLYAMKHTLDMENARLFSIDKKHWYPHEIISPQLTLIEKKSIDALLPLYLEIGAFDMMLHDGCHNTLDMYYDLHFGYACLRKGGVIACDDHSWNNGRVWEEFTHMHNLKVSSIGSVAYAFKETVEVLVKDTAKYFSDIVLEAATLKEKMWLEAGNTNHPAFD